MIEFHRYKLDNGLRVIVHEDTTTPMAVVNVLYDVGARDEDPEKTGFAHLFEHLMFGGSVNIPVYDEPLQRVGGENNAFTSNDITNYYIQLPAVNLETAFWLESDRMLGLAFSDKSLEVQKNVVSEEFKQRYLNQPYGDVWLKLRPLAFKVHPYRWATIGKDLSHIENATMEDVRSFFYKHYNPLNAILVVAGNVKKEEVLSLAEKWFGPIPSGTKYNRNLPKEPVQQEARKLEIRNEVPLDSIYKVYHMCSRTDPRYYSVDLLSDILSRGESSRLYIELVKKKCLFSDLHAYLTSDMDEGLFIIEGKLVKGITMQQAEDAIEAELNRVREAGVNTKELTKVKNKIESSLVFAEMNLLDKAMNIAYFELLGDASMLNEEVIKYLAVTDTDVRERAEELFKPENSSTLYYYSAN